MEIVSFDNYFSDQNRRGIGERVGIEKVCESLLNLLFWIKEK